MRHSPSIVPWHADRDTPLEMKMMRIAAAILASILSVAAAVAQSTAASGEKPLKVNPNCPPDSKPK
jgi:hypothetical protein